MKISITVLARTWTVWHRLQLFFSLPTRSSHPGQPRPSAANTHSVCVGDECVLLPSPNYCLPLTVPSQIFILFLLSTLLFSFSLHCSSAAVQLSRSLMYFCDKSHHCRALSFFSERVPISLYNALNLSTLVIFGLNACVSWNFQIRELKDWGRQNLLWYCSNTASSLVLEKVDSLG